MILLTQLAYTRHCIIIVGVLNVKKMAKAKGVGGLSVLCCFIGAEWSNLPRVCAGSGGFLSCLRRV